MEAPHQTGTWSVEYPETLRALVQDTANAWEQFCLLPHEVQDVFTATNVFNGVGFERKTGTGTADSRFSKDKKYNFDVTQQGIDALRNRLASIDDSESRAVAAAYIEAAALLSHEASTAIEAFGAQLEQQYGIAGFKELAVKSAPNAFFRSLYYPPTESAGEIIGEPHVDNSGFTLHLFESTGGCEALSQDQQTWYPMPVTEDAALAFPSMQTQLFSEGKIDGLCHRIIANETTHKVGRRAIVCFIPLADTPAYDRGRHGRLQEKQPGFNYGMDPQEFADLFV